MCNEIWIPSEEREIRNVGDLMARVGRGNVHLRSGYGPDALKPDCCLCPIDIDAAAMSAGFTVDRSDPFFDVWLVR